MLKHYAVIVMTFLMSALPAVAQTYERDVKKLSGDQSVMYQWLIGTVFLIGSLVVAFKPAKRSNLR
jgi:hypothetical protein